MPSFLTESRLNTPDADAFDGRMVPGAPLDDAPIHRDGQAAWLLDQVGNHFTLIVFANGAEDVAAQAGMAEALRALCQGGIPVRTLLVTPNGVRSTPGEWPQVGDTAGLVAQRFDATPGTCYLIRPDQHVAARWRCFDAAAVRVALARATAQNAEVRAA